MSNSYTTSTEARMHRAQIEQKIKELQVQIAQEQALNNYKKQIEKSMIQTHNSISNSYYDQIHQQMYPPLNIYKDPSPKPIQKLSNMLGKVL